MIIPDINLLLYAHNREVKQHAAAGVVVGSHCARATRHLDIVAQLFQAAGVADRLTTDVHLAALAIEYQATLHTNDTDFSRFPGLRHSDPLA